MEAKSGLRLKVCCLLSIVVGHDGDKREESRRIDDAYLDSLIERIDRDEKSNESAQLWRQPGDFRASIKELDDIQVHINTDWLVGWFSF